MSIKTKKQIYYLEYSNSDRELVHHFNKLVDSFVEIIEKEMTFYTYEDLEDFRKELLLLPSKEKVRTLEYYVLEFEENLRSLEYYVLELEEKLEEVKDERDLYKSKVDRYEED